MGLEVFGGVSGGTMKDSLRILDCALLTLVNFDKIKMVDPNIILRENR